MKGKAFSDGLTAEASKGITSRDRFPEKLSSTFQEAAIRRHARRWCDEREGSIRHVNGEEYAGGFREGFIYGKGRYTWPDGQVYEGSYETGVREGKGQLTYANGDQFVGSFEKGLPPDKGSLPMLMEAVLKENLRMD